MPLSLYTLVNFRLAFFLLFLLVHAVVVERRLGQLDRLVRDVALQVAFERRTLKPVFQLIGFRLWV